MNGVNLSGEGNFAAQVHPISGVVVHNHIDHASNTLESTLTYFSSRVFKVWRFRLGFRILEQCKRFPELRVSERS